MGLSNLSFCKENAKKFGQTHKENGYLSERGKTVTDGK
jgi:hypothetical protein